MRKIFVEKIPVKQVNDKINNQFKVLLHICVNLKKTKGKFIHLFVQIIEGLLFDLYFEEEMHSKDLSIMEYVEEDLANTKLQKAYNQMKEKDYLQLADELYKTWTDPFNEVRNRLKLFATRSPKLLAQILKTE